MAVQNLSKFYSHSKINILYKVSRQHRILSWFRNHKRKLTKPKMPRWKFRRIICKLPLKLSWDYRKKLSSWKKTIKIKRGDLKPSVTSLSKQIKRKIPSSGSLTLLRIKLSSRASVRLSILKQWLLSKLSLLEITSTVLRLALTHKTMQCQLRWTLSEMLETKKNFRRWLKLKSRSMNREW